MLVLATRRSPTGSRMKPAPRPRRSRDEPRSGSISRDFRQSTESALAAERDDEEESRLLELRWLLKKRTNFLAKVYVELCALQTGLVIYTGLIEYALGKRWASNTLRMDANHFFIQYIIFASFGVLASIALFKMRTKSRGGLDNVDFVLFAVSFALGLVLIVFIYYPCKEDYWPAILAIFGLTLVSLCCGALYLLFSSSGMPSTGIWMIIILAALAIDAVIFVPVYVSRDDMDALVPVWQYVLAWMGAAVATLALVVVTRTTVRSQMNRLLDENAETDVVLGREEPYTFATLHASLLLLFIELSFAACLHYKRIFYTWYETRLFNWRGGSECVQSDIEM